MNYLVETRKIFTLYFLSLLVAVGAMQGCTSANPIKAAETNEQRAYAIYGTFVIFSEKAADLAENPSLPRNVRLSLVEAEEDASPIVDGMLEVFAEYQVIEAEFKAGMTTEERFLTVANNLNSWVNRVAPLVNRLVARVEEARE